LHLSPAPGAYRVAHRTPSSMSGAAWARIGSFSKRNEDVATKNCSGLSGESGVSTFARPRGHSGSSGWIGRFHNREASAWPAGMTANLSTEQRKPSRASFASACGIAGSSMRKGEARCMHFLQDTVSRRSPLFQKKEQRGRGADSFRSPDVPLFWNLKENRSCVYSDQENFCPVASC
jgi:hypothetical protein